MDPGKKSSGAKYNKTFKMDDVEQLTHKALDLVTQHDWKKYVILSFRLFYQITAIGSTVTIKKIWNNISKV